MKLGAVQLDPSCQLGCVSLSVTFCALAYAPWALTHLPASVASLRPGMAVVVLGLVCTALGFTVFFQLMADVGAHRSLVVTFVNPAVAVALGVGFLGDPFGLGTGFGLVMILGGSYLSTRRPGRPAGIYGQREVATGDGEQAAGIAR